MKKSFSKNEQEQLRNRLKEDKKYVILGQMFRFYSDKPRDILLRNLIENYSNLNEITNNEALKRLLYILLDYDKYLSDLSRLPLNDSMNE